MNDGARAIGLEKMSGASIYPSAQNILLAARALGLASALTTLHLLYEKDVKEALALPENAETFAILPIGWPMGKFGPVSREPVESMTFFNQWGQTSTVVAQEPGIWPSCVVCIARTTPTGSVATVL